MSKEKEYALEGESCHVCGSELYLVTEAEQPDPMVETTKSGTTYSFFALDGDRAYCKECGFEAYASVDSESADIMWDEMSPHNVKCAEDYEKKQEAEKMAKQPSAIKTRLTADELAILHDGLCGVAIGDGPCTCLVKWVEELQKEADALIEAAKAK